MTGNTKQVKNVEHRRYKVERLARGFYIRKGKETKKNKTRMVDATVGVKVNVTSRRRITGYIACAAHIVV